MDNLAENSRGGMKAFLNHVFSTTNEDSAELMNNVQYALVGAIPILMLNKAIQRFIPDLDPDKSATEILIEVIFQILGMICGVVIIHRVITFMPTYSGVKHDSICLSSSILLFLVVILSLQTKLGTKMNILWDRAMATWDGSDRGPKPSAKDGMRRANFREGFGSGHASSQADTLDDAADDGPPAPQSQSRNDGARNARQAPIERFAQSVMPANAVIGSNFGNY